MKSRQKGNTAKLFLGLAVMLTLLRLAFFLTLPLDALGNAVHDDMNQALASDYLYRGLWLGPFSDMTLIKGISYPLFLAFARRLMIPSPVLLCLFYVLSASLFVYALRDEIRKPALRFVLYLCLLYAPPGFDGDTAQRVYRNVLMYPAVLLVAASLTGLYFACRHGKKKLLWLLAAGFGFTFFYYIREDSIYLLPLFICGLLYCFYCGILRDVRKGQRLRAALRRLPQVLVPVLIFVILTLSLRFVNYRAYGEFVTNDRTEGAFAALSGDLLKIEEGRRYASGQRRDPEAFRDPTDFWVTDETIRAAMEVSPTLASIEKEVFSQRETWGTLDKDLPGDMFTWAMRSALTDAGYFADGKAMQAFCAAAHEEISAALKDGLLTRAPGLYFSSSSRGITASDLPYYLAKAAKNLWRLGTYPLAAPSLNAGTGTPEQIRFLEVAGGMHAIYPDGVLSEGSDYALGAYSQPAALARLIIRLYRLASFAVLPLAFLAFVWNLVTAVRRKRWECSSYAVLAAGFLLTAYVLSFGLSLFTEWLPDHRLYYYGSAAPALIFAFAVISFTGFFRNSKTANRQPG